MRVQMIWMWVVRVVCVCGRAYRSERSRMPVTHELTDIKNMAIQDHPAVVNLIVPADLSAAVLLHALRGSERTTHGKRRGVCRMRHFRRECGGILGAGVRALGYLKCLPFWPSMSYQKFKK